MADKSKIGWLRGLDGTLGASWNYVRGCNRKSPGCVFCYAEGLAARFSDPGQWGHGYAVRTKNGGRWTGKLGIVAHLVDQPRRWRKARRVFVNSTSDLFHKKMPWPWIRLGFQVMDEVARHTYLILTKRPDVMVDFAEKWLAEHGGKPPAQIWLGCSVENQEWADKRRRDMRRLSAAGWNTFVSYEPALGRVDWTAWEFLDWMISGDESGRRRRDADLDWHRETRDWCDDHSVPYYLKQRIIAGAMVEEPELDGVKHVGYGNA